MVADAREQLFPASESQVSEPILIFCLLAPIMIIC